MNLFSKTNLWLICAIIIGAFSTANAQEVAVQRISEPAATPQLSNIRYVDFDIIRTRFTKAIEVQQWVTDKTDSIQSVLSKKAKAITDFEAKIIKKNKNNQYKTEAAYKADVTKYEKMVGEYQTLEAKLQKEAQEENNRRTLALQEMIFTYLTEYNAIHKYDAILLKSAGLIFNPALDITDEIVAGLNGKYNPPVEIVIPTPDQGLEPIKAEDNTITP